MRNVECIQDKMGDIGLKRMMKRAVREESFISDTSDRTSLIAQPLRIAFLE